MSLMKDARVYPGPLFMDGDDVFFEFMSTAGGSAIVVDQADGEALVLTKLFAETMAASVGDMAVTNSAGSTLFAYSMTSTGTENGTLDVDWGVGVRLKTSGGDNLTVTAGTTNARVTIEGFKVKASA